MRIQRIYKVKEKKQIKLQPPGAKLSGQKMWRDPDNVCEMKKETQLEAQMNSFTSELTANEARKDPYVLTQNRYSWHSALMGFK